MKKIKKILGIAAVVMAAAVFIAGCTREEKNGSSGKNTSGAESEDAGTEEAAGGQEERKVTELNVRFGDDGKTFVLHLEENKTAKAIARYTGTSDWRLPIYEDDENADYDVLQYYDIPDTYEIPSESRNVKQAKAGDVFYSEPNRIVLFYRDAKISEEYTRIGRFKATDAFVTAVEENPVLEGWGNKIIQITQP